MGRWIATMALLSMMVGCDEAPTPPPAAPAPGPVAEEPAAPAGPRAEADEFVLTAVAAEGGYTAGSAGSFAIRLTPRGPWHVNTEYPISVELSAPGELSLPKVELEAGDAAELGEELALYDVAFTPAVAGQHLVEAIVHFGLCQDEACIFQDRTLALALPVH